MAFSINLTDILGASGFGQSRTNINSNFLTLKDTIEDLFNGFSVDITGNKFGTSSLDITGKSINIINGKYKVTYTQGTTDITRDIISITGVNSNEIKIDNIDHLTVNIDSFINVLEVNELVISNSGDGLTNDGVSILNGATSFGSSLTESLVDVNIELDSAGEGTLNINANTQNNLFLVLDATNATLASNFNINPVIDSNTPDGLVFTVYLKDINGSTTFETSPANLVNIYYDRDKTIITSAGQYKIQETPYNTAISCMVINNGVGKRLIIKSVHNLE